ncbi:MAG: tRNA dihydrouridine synthase DusB [Firmicutes bacterium]|nr:tRNA dihydrouridine synthase DusB [Bacillota bacterium]
MIILAPMAGITDIPFRKIAKSFDCDFVISEMVSAKGIVYQSTRTKELLEIEKSERPVAIQLFGCEPEIMAEAARFIEETVNPDMIDINMGCPTPKIVKNGDGSALLKEPEKAEKVAAAVVNAVRIPVTVKTRLGWDADNINILDIAQRLESVGVHWITLHARTRDQFYSGTADWRWIKKLKETIKIPVVGNGDIFSPEDAKRMIEETNCDHIMVGRGALGNPWIFTGIKRYLETGTLPEPPSNSARIEMAKKHLRMKVELNGEVTGVKEMRPHLGWYLKGMKNSASIRAKINQITSYDEVVALLDSLLV